MAEFRFNPLLGQYTIVASNRQNRPQMPKDWCPFCPGSGKVPESYTVLNYPNDFPAMSLSPSLPDAVAGGPYETKENIGACEVILFSSDHHASLHSLSLAHLQELIGLWKTRFEYYAAIEEIQYIYEFENRGEEVGVTMPHPHGQLYAFPFVPQKIELELQNAKKYWETNGVNLFEAMNAQELKDGRRMIFENEHFLCYLPFFTDYPYGAFIVAKDNLLDFRDFSASQMAALAYMLKYLTGAFDSLFDRPFPYMMAIHQGPVNNSLYTDCQQYYRFHIEFYPVLRDAHRIKYYAGCEMGTWTAANTRAVEETALELKAAWEKFSANEHK